MKKKDYYWKRSGNLKSQIRKIFTIIICIYLAIMIIFFGIVGKNYFYSYYKTTNQDALASAIVNLNAFSDNISVMSRMLMFSEEATDFLCDESYNYTKRVDLLRKIYNIMDYYEQISSVYLFKLTGEYVNVSMSHNTMAVNRELFSDEDWMQQIKEKEGYYLVQLDGNGLFVPHENEHIITYIRLINDLDTQRPIGMIAVNCSTDMLKSIVDNSLGEHGSLVILSEEKEELAGESQNINEEILEASLSEDVRGEIVTRISKGNIVTTAHAENAPFVFLKCSELSFGNYPKGDVLMLVFILSVLSLVVIVCLNVFVSMKIVSPIEKLTASMKKSKEGYLYRVSMDSGIDEINILKDSYNDMLVEINRLLLEVVEKERGVQQAKFEVILEQINPHFLYNTLETIGYLALDSTGEDVYDAIVSLGDFYRSFLNNGDEMITVQKEVDMVRNYMKLQRLRYEDIFEEQYDIEPSVLEYKIPKLLLQPLVENALYHGIRLKGEKGIIKISAQREADLLVIAVYDSGIGMTQEKIEEVLKEEKEGFGLKKTLQRVSYLYNKETPYRIESKVGYYCKIELLIPLTESEE